MANWNPPDAEIPQDVARELEKQLRLARGVYQLMLHEKPGDVARPQRAAILKRRMAAITRTLAKVPQFDTGEAGEEIDRDV